MSRNTNGQKVPFSERMRRFFEGRNGNDAFSRFLTWSALIFLIISMLTGSVLNGVLSSILWWIALAELVYGYFRIFSKNIYARQRENDKYLAIKKKIFGDPDVNRRKRAERSTYKYFKCPSCKKEMRAPRGKGRIKVTCRECGNVFYQKT